MVDLIQFYITFFIKTKTAFGYSLTQYLVIDVKTLPTKTLCYVIIICWFLISGNRQFNLLIS